MPRTRKLRTRAGHLPCPYAGCDRSFKNHSGLTQHSRMKHPLIRHTTPPSHVSDGPPLSPINQTSEHNLSNSESSSKSPHGWPRYMEYQTPPHSPHTDRIPEIDLNPQTPPLHRGDAGMDMFPYNSPPGSLHHPTTVEFDGYPQISPISSSHSDFTRRLGSPTPPPHSSAQPSTPQFESDDRTTDGYRNASAGPIPVRPTQNSTKSAFGTKTFHPLINGTPCDEDGDYLPLNSPPPPRNSPADTRDNWAPYQGKLEFLLAEFLYTRSQMSAGNIDTILSLWAASLAQHNASAPFSNHNDLYNTIDSTPLGNVPWQSFNLHYEGERPNGDIPTWMDSQFEVWFRDPRTLVQNMIANPDFDHEFDCSPFQEYDTAGDNHRFQDFMSGNWAWKQADLIAEDPNTHGSMFVPIILGSDKTMVSVATGNNEYWPVYLSIGNIHNNVRRAHRNSSVLLGFLSTPKSDKKYVNDTKFRHFRRQLYHTSLARILSSLKPGMTTPEVVRCPDGHFRRAVYGLGPYIADYPEQALLACVVQGWCPKCTAPMRDLDDGEWNRRTRDHTELIVQELELGVLWEEYGLVGDIVPFTNDFPRADIHELLSPDLLHQLIKGTFKDHIVTWIGEYLVASHGQARANEILDDIDKRIAAVPPFTGLRRFPQGRGFKQWTGDDSKALMKVYLPAIKGHVPQEMVRALRAFLEFCYIARRNAIDSNSLLELNDALARFHRYRTIFQECNIRPSGFSLPRQHSMVHYYSLIRSFGAPNGLCSSITESKHIEAVKKPWRRSNRYEALGQILLTNQRLDKIAASRIDFSDRGMLDGTSLSDILGLNDSNNDVESPNESSGNRGPGSAGLENDDAGGDDGDVPEVGPNILAHVDLAKTIQRKVSIAILAAELNQPNLYQLIQQFLYDQLHSATDTDSSSSIDVLTHMPQFDETIAVYTSAVATFYSPSDPGGASGIRREWIRTTPSWRKGPGRYDCIFVNTDQSLQGMRGLDIARVRSFLSVTFGGKTYPCALIHWFSRIGDGPDEDTGMWIVEPDLNSDNSPRPAVIHLDTIVRAAHLIGAYGEDFLPQDLAFHNSLDELHSFYVNKFADHHAFEVAF